MAAKRVLVVDDDPEFQEMISEVLSGSGFESVPALSGVDGMSILAQNPDIDALILDVMMPGMDGYEVCRKLKESEATSLPIVFLSAKTQPEDIELAYKVGGDDYITKPFDNSHLIDVLDRVISQGSAGE